ncbi:BQ2448_6663 [Microbotryum intermedium]|uniref:BQ2448_6663 protein n=1 Tax=Microbotryum intermedium TaxID=269621 RepID=A0A238FPV7_9BASI|nr:BQ2448_6663 [Microbotryum intermedium]
MSKHAPNSVADSTSTAAGLLDPALPTHRTLDHTKQHRSHRRHSSHLPYVEPGSGAAQVPHTYASESASCTRAAAIAPAAASRRRKTRPSATHSPDRLAVDLAIAASLSEIEMQRNRAEREEAELCQALLESAVLARSAVDPLSTMQGASSTEHPVSDPSTLPLSRHDHRTDAALEPQGNETVAPNPMPSEEWLSYARLREDVVLWLENGAPEITGTATVTSSKTDDEYEREMLELAIRISLEEAAQLERGRHAFSASADLEAAPTSLVANRANLETGQAQVVAEQRRKSVPTSVFLEDLAPIRRPRSSSEPPTPSQHLHSPTSVWSKESGILDYLSPSIQVDKGKQVDRSYSVPDEQAWIAGAIAGNSQSVPIQHLDSSYEPSFYTPPTSSSPRCLTPQAGHSSRLIECPSMAQTQIRTSQGSTPLQPTICAAPSLSSDAVSIEFASPASESPFDPFEALTVEIPRPHRPQPAQAEDTAQLEDPLSQFSGRPLSHVSEQSEPGSEGSWEQSRPSLRRMGRLPPSVGSIELDTAQNSSTPPHNASPSMRKTVTFEEALAMTPTAELTEPQMTSPKSKPSTIAALVESSLTVYAALAASIVSPQQLSRSPTTDPDPSACPTGAPEDNSLNEVVFGYLTSFPGSLAAEAVTVDAPFHQKFNDTPFPEEIELSSVEPNRRSFAIETSRWSTLLKFMMWQGDVKLSTTCADQIAHERPAECGATLTFRTTVSGQHVLRLVIVLISIDHTTVFGQAHELNIVNHLTCNTDSTRPSQAKSKARQVAHTTFFLPDPQVLPTRMSTLSISLFVLRHLAHIAQSTQPAKDASASYHALRNLATAIQASPPRATQSGTWSKDGENKHAEEEDLLSRMRERLRKLKKSPCPLNLRNLPCSQLAKVPYPVVVDEDADAVFGIGSTPSGGLFTVHTPPRSSLDVPAGISTARRNSRSTERSRPSTPIGRTRTQEVPAGPRNSVDGPRLGLGMIIRPRRVDPNGEISDLSEDEVRWLPTLSKRDDYFFRFRD